MGIRNEAKVIEGWDDRPGGCKMFRLVGDDFGVRISIPLRVDYRELDDVLEAIRQACQTIRPPCSMGKPE